MERPSVSARLRYAFDNYMSRGTIALVIGLAIASIVLIVGIAAIVVALGGMNDQATEGVGPIQLMWMTLLRTLDPGTMGGDTGTIVFVGGMFTATLGGIFIVAALIGIINTGLEGKLDELRKGRSKVIEQDHTVILGWSPQIFSVLSELILANESRRNQCIVVLADQDKVEMEDAIHQRLPDTKTTRIVCRSGSPLDIDELDIASPQTARAIICLSPTEGDRDADVIRTLLAVTNAPSRREQPYHLIAEIHEARNIEVATLASRGEAVCVLAGDLIGRIAAQACRQPGLSVVYMDLLDFEGNEFYFHSEPSLVGLTYGETLSRYRDSAVSGIVPVDGTPVLNPPMDRVLVEGDKLIMLAEDDASIHLDSAEAPTPDTSRIADAAPAVRAPERALLLGWNHRSHVLLRELDRYCTPGSEISVISMTPEAGAEAEAVARNFENSKLTFQVADTSSRDVLNAAHPETFDHVVIMSYSDHLDPQRADGKTLVSLLHLRDIAQKTGRGFSIVSEMLDLRNRNLASVTRSDDFIVSDRLVSLTMTQLAENPGLKPVLDDLFDVDGSEVYLKPATDYIRPGGPVDFYTVVEAARRRGQTAMGYRLLRQANNSKANYGVTLNPDKSKPVDLGEDDQVIVLAED
jgi:voltage-gated potassium channel Kch